MHQLPSVPVHHVPSAPVSSHPTLSAPIVHHVPASVVSGHQGSTTKKPSAAESKPNYYVYEYKPPATHTVSASVETPQHATFAALGPLPQPQGMSDFQYQQAIIQHRINYLKQQQKQKHL